MRLPRITIRSLMCVVIGVGVLLHVTLGTIRVNSVRTDHFHTWVQVQAGKPLIIIRSLRSPYWPRYWRSLLGIPSEKLPLCHEVEGRLLDTCEYAHPEIKDVSRTNIARAQLDLYRRLANP
jgi:hypothetical protein